MIAILTPTLSERAQLRQRLQKELNRQISAFGLTHPPVILLSYEDQGEMTTGAKRNLLTQRAIDYGASYVANFDDDDMPGPTYIQRMMDAEKSGFDCAELWGQIYFNGIKGNPFHHSIKHQIWWQDEKYYYRCPNHLSLMKLSLIKDIPYPDITVGEDGQFSMSVEKAGVLKTEYPIPEIIYHYYCGFPKHEVL